MIEEEEDPEKNNRDLEGGGGEGVLSTTNGTTVTSGDLPSTEDEKEKNQRKMKHNRIRSAILIVQSLGVIYGDIGTSPLYVFATIFSTTVSPTSENVYGALSLIIWSLLLIVTIKYIIFVLMADSDGEGGTFALQSLLMRAKDRIGKFKMILITVFTCFAAAFVLGDGAFTPAISILSAMEGINVGIPNFSDTNIIIIAIVIVFVLFIFQEIGTGKIGLLFGPIMLVWFLSIFILGIYNVSKEPSVFQSFSPHYGILYIVRNGWGGFLTLSAVFLTVTGVEAMYADIGHLSIASVRISWLCIVYPALMLQYLGQGSYLLLNPSSVSTLFFTALPGGTFWPMLILANVATVIASQALISGVFALISQAIALNLFPRLRTFHTSKNYAGQVYIREVNFILMIMCLALIGGLQHSSKLLSAYGLSINVVLLMTTLLYTLVMYYTWNWKWWTFIFFPVLFVFVESCFLLANVVKIPDGAYLSLILGGFWFTLFMCWYFGTMLLKNDLKKQGFMLTKEEMNTIENGRSELDNPDDSSSNPSLFLDNDLKIVKQKPIVNLTGIFISSTVTGIPSAFNYFVATTNSVPSKIIFLYIKIEPTPYIEDKRITITYGIITRVVLRFGFAEKFDVVDALQNSPLYHTLLPDKKSSPDYKDDADVNPDNNDNPCYFFGSEKVNVTKKHNILLRPLIYIYSLLLKNSSSLVDELIHPPNKMMDVTVHVDL